MITNTPAVAYLNCQTVSQQLVADRPRSYQVRVRRLLHHRRLRDAQRTTAIAANCDRTRLDGRTGHPGSIDPDDGRPRQTHVYLDHPQVSRVHAALIAREEQPAVEDLGSRSGPQSTACASTRRRQAPRRHGQSLLVEHRR